MEIRSLYCKNSSLNCVLEKSPWFSRFCFGLFSEDFSANQRSLWDERTPVIGLEFSSENKIWGKNNLFTLQFFVVIHNFANFFIHLSLRFFQRALQCNIRVENISSSRFDFVNVSRSTSLRSETQTNRIPANFVSPKRSFDFLSKFLTNLFNNVSTILSLILRKNVVRV